MSGMRHSTRDAWPYFDAVQRYRCCQQHRQKGSTLRISETWGVMSVLTGCALHRKKRSVLPCTCCLCVSLKQMMPPTITSTPVSSFTSRAAAARMSSLGLTWIREGGIQGLGNKRKSPGEQNSDARLPEMPGLTIPVGTFQKFVPRSGPWRSCTTRSLFWVSTTATPTPT